MHICFNSRAMYCLSLTIQTRLRWVTAETVTFIVQRSWKATITIRQISVRHFLTIWSELITTTLSKKIYSVSTGSDDKRNVCDYAFQLFHRCVFSETNRYWFKRFVNLVGLIPSYLEIFNKNFSPSNSNRCCSLEKLS